MFMQADTDRTFGEFHPTIDFDLPWQWIVCVEGELEVSMYVPRIFV